MLGSLAGVNVRNWDTAIPPSYLGGECNVLANTDDDPHFRGADGTRYDFNGLLDRSFCLLSDRRIHLEQERLSMEELGELERMRTNGSLPLTAEVVAALEQEMGRRSGREGGESGGEEEKQHSIHAQHSAFFKARDGKEQRRGSSGFVDRLELDGLPVAPPLSAGSSIVGNGGFKLLLAETRSCKGKDEDEFHLTIDGVVDMGITARLAHPLMQTATEAQAHFNVHIDGLNHTSGIHGVLGQTFRAEESRNVRSLRYRLLTRLLREPVEVESESGRGFLDGRTEDYITSDIRSADCMYAAVWRRGEHEHSDGSDFM
ncbi:unnamed protein product [Closterium sp. Naga37s-1]|nr:unnamed protein product [Closterium sp. Naga37s-1]